MEHVTGNDPEKRDRLMKGLDVFLERDRDRELFDLPRSDRTRAGCFRWRRDDVPWQSRKPTSERTTKNRKIPSGASGGRCAGSSSRSSNWTTPIRRARNASSSARRPVNASRSDERAPGTFFLPATAERLRALLRAVLGLSTDRSDSEQLSTCFHPHSFSSKHPH